MRITYRYGFGKDTAEIHTPNRLWGFVLDIYLRVLGFRQVKP